MEPSQLDDDLEDLLRQSVDADVVTLLSRRLGLSAERAIDLYYASALARQVDQGAFGIQYLSPEYLVEDLMENEAALVARFVG